ncbi:polyprotein [Goose pegivirus 1]|nr:polyprotein [Goose pegivirus 1]
MATLVVFVLLALCPAGVAPLSMVARHACLHNGTYQLTNCCAPEEVYFCNAELCLTAHGCVVCEKGGGCWDLVASGISTRNVSISLESALYDHVGLVVVTAYICDGLGLGEQCSLALTAYLLSVAGFGHHHELACNYSCIVELSDNFAALLEQSDLGMFFTLIRWVLRVPVAIWEALTATSGIVAVIALIYLLEERIIHAVLLLLFLTTVSGRDVRSQSEITKLWYKVRPVPKDVSKDFLPCVPRPTRDGHSCTVLDLKRGRVYTNYSTQQVPDFKQWYNWTGPCTSRLTTTDFSQNGVWDCQPGPIIWDAPYGNNSGYVPYADTVAWHHTCDKQVYASCPKGKSCGVLCVWGGYTMHWKGGVTGYLTSFPSAMCYFYDEDTKPFHTCWKDGRSEWCGNCSRDCWPETGDVFRSFKHCGMGPHLVPGVRGKVFERKNAHKFIQARIGNKLHTLVCPGDAESVARGSPLLKYLPGEPVDATEVGRTLPLAPINTVGSVRMDPYGEVCRGYAFLYGNPGDGLIHLHGDRQIMGARSVASSNRGFDAFVAVLVLMKLAGGRWVPLAVAGLWAHLIYNHGAYAAVGPWFPAGPMVSAGVMARDWYTTVLIALNIVVYIRSRWAGRIASLVGFKLASGYIFATWLGLLTALRGGKSVAGVRCRLCIDFGELPNPDGPWSIALVLSYFLITAATFTKEGRCIKLKIYKKWAKFYAWLYDRVEAGPLGGDSLSTKKLVVWFVACGFFPQEMLCIYLWTYCCLGLIDAFDVFFESMVIMQPNLERTCKTLARLVELPTSVLVGRLQRYEGVKWLDGYLKNKGAQLRFNGKMLAKTMAEASVDWDQTAEIRADALAWVRGRRDAVCGRRGSQLIIARRGYRLPPGYVLVSVVALATPVSAADGVRPPCISYLLRPLALLMSIIIEYYAAQVAIRAVRRLVKLVTCCGCYLYDHRGDLGPWTRLLASAQGWTLEPLALLPKTWKFRIDRTRRLACGDQVDGLPVVARFGDKVMLGPTAGHLPPGFHWAGGTGGFATSNDLTPWTPRRLATLLRVCGTAEQAASVISAAARAGVYAYNHCGQLHVDVVQRLLAWGFCVEPAAPGGVSLEAASDETGVLRCGHTYRGRPVVARKGSMVLLGQCRGTEDLPPGYVLSAPVMTRSAGKNAFVVLCTSMKGRDQTEGKGNVMVLGTALTRSHGTCVTGLMFTTFHSSQGRSLAMADGPVSPRWTSPSLDIAAYPLPRGATNLELCGCATRSAWVLRTDGVLVHGTIQDGTVSLDTDGRLRDFRGSSGSPILCDQGHCHGVLVSALHRGPNVFGVKFVVPWKATPADVRQPTKDSGLPLPKEEYRVEALFCGTGSGKSTRVPAEYCKLGYRVLVLNPSVATTAAMPSYMRKAYSISPNVYAGHGPGAVAVNTGAALTYATYGRFLGGERRLLKSADIVICDEGHSTDPTSILGIGAVLAEAEAAGVKMVVVATATPPGSQVTPHPNIEEERLLEDGDVPFYGVTLNSTQYLTGRHLIFCHSKAECERVALDLAARRVKTVVYYRGKPIDTIPTSGDVTVVATDALSTGYTGDFATVTDCCTAIEEKVDVDLAPTITLSLRTIPCDAALRMQRRGRCGRGKSGVYRYVTAAAPPTGTVSSGSLWGAVEAGVAWFNLPKRSIELYMGAYRDSPYTPVYACALEDAVEYMEELRKYNNSQEVQKMMAAGVNWPLISGAQYHLCRVNEAQAPSNDPRWAGLTGSNKVPLIARWGVSIPPFTICDVTQALQTALGVPADTVMFGPALMVGMAVAAAAAIVNSAGTLVVVAYLQVGTADQGRLSQETDPLYEALAAVETQLSWDAVSQIANSTLACAKDVGCTVAKHYTTYMSSPTAKSTLMAIFGKMAAHWATICTGAVALTSAGASPVLASAAAAACGIYTNLPITAGMAVAVVAGAAATLIGGQGSGLAVAGAFLAGATASTVGLGASVVAWGITWEAAITGASLTFGMLHGKADSSTWTRAVAMLGNPAASIVGAVVGCLLYRASGGKGTREWTNRLLASLPRNMALPDEFYLSGDPRDKVWTALQKLSIVETTRVLIASMAEGGETPCSSTFWELCGEALHWIRSILDWVVNWVRGHMPAVGVPIVHCQRPYTGKWAGTGVVVGVCPCGNTTTLQITKGQVIWRQNTNWLCMAALRGGVPINTKGTSRGPIPVEVKLEGGVVARYPYGFSDWVEIQYTAAGPVLVASTCVTISRGSLQCAVSQKPVLVGGVSMSWSSFHTPSVMTFGAGATIIYGGVAVKLPHPLTTGQGLDKVDVQPSEPQELLDDDKASFDGFLAAVDVESSPPIVDNENVEPYLGYGSGPKDVVRTQFRWKGAELIKKPLWGRPGMTCRQVKRALSALAATRLDLSITRKGHEYCDDEVIPLMDPDVELDVTRMIDCAFENPAFCNDELPELEEDSEPPPVYRGPDMPERRFTYTINCCGLEDNQFRYQGIAVWQRDQSLGGAVATVLERQIADALLYGRYERVWSPLAMSCHVPKLDGKKVSWDIGTSSLADLAVGPTPHLTLVCNNPTDRCVDPDREYLPGYRETKVVIPCLGKVVPLLYKEGQLVCQAFTGEWHNQHPNRAAWPGCEEVVLCEHRIKIGGMMLDGNDRFCEDHRDKPFIFSCLHGLMTPPNEMPVLLPAVLPPPPPANQLVEVELQPVRKPCVTLVLRSECCGGAENEWDGMEIPVSSDETIIDAVVAHVEMTCDFPWTAEEFNKHEFGSGDHVWTKTLTPGQIGLSGKVTMSVRCPLKEKPPSQEIELTPTTRRSELLVACDCKHGTYEGRYNPGDAFSVPLATLGIIPGLHDIVVNGKKYSADDGIPSDAHEHQWVVHCEVSESSCGMSYLWSGVPLRLREMTPRPPTNPIGNYLRVNVAKAYRTDPARVGERIAKVTIEQQEAVVDDYLRDAYNLALAKAGQIKSPGYDYDTAVSKVRPRAAPGHNVQLSVKDLKTERGKAIVLQTLDEIRRGVGDHPFQLTCKQEVFAYTKKTPKPPRLICYPSLEFRVAEKMIMGDPGLVAKAVLGPGYGFAYTPQGRVSRLLQMWKEKKDPTFVTMDATCFDSTITTADVERETEIYARASDDPDAVRALGKRYAEGPMVSRGVVVGYRRCRASGVLTTSSSNSITCYLKVSAAIRAVGGVKPSYLINGDDCVVCVEGDIDTDALKAHLAKYGYVCDPTKHKTLTTVEACSSFVREVFTDRREYFLACNMERALARASSEWSDPIAVSCGYTLLYPHHPITRYLLIPQLLALLFKSGKSPDDDVVCEVRGNRLTFPLKQLPNILVGLHGPGAIRVRADSHLTLAEANKALQIMGARGLSWYKRRHVRLRVTLLRAGGGWARLAQTLMWLPSTGPPPSVAPLLDEGLFQEFWEAPWTGTEVVLPTKQPVPRWRQLATAALVGVSGMLVAAVLTAGLQ